MPKKDRIHISVFALMFAVAITSSPLLVSNAQAQPSIAHKTPLTIDHALNVVGFDGVPANHSGQLIFRNDILVFASGKDTGSVPYASIRSFGLQHSTKGLIRGATGSIATAAPQGLGQIYGAIRRGAETLSIFYADENQAIHGAVIILPKERKEEVLKAFANAGLTPSDSHLPLVADPAASIAAQEIRHHVPLPGARRSVQVSLPTSSVQNMPVAYFAVAYEDILARAEKSGTFDTIWRAGDVRAEPDVMKLDVSVTRFRKGNAGIRGAIPIAGMLMGKTLITAKLRLTDASGKVLYEKDVEGSKRMSGESLEAAESLAKRVSDSMKKEYGDNEDIS